MKRSGYIFLFLFFILLVCIGGFLYASFWPTQSIFGNVVSTTTIPQSVMLTFDDGPGEETAAILDVLAVHEVHAVFFVVGEQVRQYPELVIRMQEEGHVIGVHTMTHPYLLTNVSEEILTSKQLIVDEFGIEVNFFRPPYGFRTPRVLDLAEQANLITVTWTVFPRDYVMDAQTILVRSLTDLRAGDIICLHDGPMNREETLKALPELITQIQEQGLQFTTRFY